MRFANLLMGLVALVSVVTWRERAGIRRQRSFDAQ